MYPGPGVPPAIAMVTVPSFCPQFAVVIKVALIAIAVGCVKITDAVDVQPIASVTVKVIWPAHKLVPVAVVCAFDHK